MGCSTSVVPLDVSHVDVVRFTFFVFASGAVLHISAQLGGAQPGSTARKWAIRIAERMRCTSPTSPHIKYACMTSAIMFCMVAPLKSLVSIFDKLRTPPTACRSRLRNASPTIPQKSKIAALSRMGGSSTLRLFWACCVLHLYMILPRAIRVLRVLRVLRVPPMCLLFRLWGHRYRVTRAARYADPSEPVVDLVGGRRRRESGG